MQRAPGERPVLVYRAHDVGVGRVLQQQLDGLRKALLDGDIQRRLLVMFLVNVEPGPPAQQVFELLGVARLDGRVERRRAARLAHLSLSVRRLQFVE